MKREQERQSKAKVNSQPNRTKQAPQEGRKERTYRQRKSESERGLPVRKEVRSIQTASNSFRRTETLRGPPRDDCRVMCRTFHRKNCPTQRASRSWSKKVRTSKGSLLKA